MAGITDDSIRRAKEVLRVLSQIKSKPLAARYISKLIDAMVERARQWKEGWAMRQSTIWVCWGVGANC